MYKWERYYVIKLTLQVPIKPLVICTKFQQTSVLQRTQVVGLLDLGYLGSWQMQCFSLSLIPRTLKTSCENYQMNKNHNFRANQFCLYASWSLHFFSKTGIPHEYREFMISSYALEICLKYQIASQTVMEVNSRPSYNVCSFSFTVQKFQEFTLNIDNMATHTTLHACTNCTII